MSDLFAGLTTSIKSTATAITRNEYVRKVAESIKGRHAINVVAVSDHRRAFLWYSRAYPGSAHDSRIFRESRLHSELSSRIKKGVLLGDSAFQAERFLLKPVLDTPADSPESRYTEALCSGRVVVEHAFGVLKRQFSALHLGLRCEPDKAGKLIAAAMCLRNAAIAMKDPEFAGENEESDDQSDDDVDTSPLAPTASAFQQLIISRFV
uniref:DDE Tnp4 domain-containing protein n=1 Tax=Caenorhabditis japonica TaxID=281687 RepID=A0A8R1J0T8_CAEJA